jgi:hypothetical protein
MGGKGGGGSNYYQMGADTSGYGTLEEAEATLKKQKPLDLSGYQQSINVKKAAAEATAKPPVPEPAPTGGGGIATQFTDAILKPPSYWNTPQTKPTPLRSGQKVQTVQS